MLARAALSLLLLASVAQVEAATLEDFLPRGGDVCYGATPERHPAFKMVRVTRPERFQSYDSAGARMVRVVINFNKPEARLEDTASCKLRGEELVCVSTSCDGTEFKIVSSQSQFSIVFEPAAPKSIWSCAELPLRALVLDEKQKSVVADRGKGSCIED